MKKIAALSGTALTIALSACTYTMPDGSTIEVLSKNNNGGAHVPPTAPYGSGGAPVPPRANPGDATTAHQCRAPHRVAIRDLGMSPNLVRHGDQIRNFSVNFSVDNNGECTTHFTVLDDKNRVVGQASTKQIRPGAASIVIASASNYRFDQKHRCFTVVANIAATGSNPDAVKRECASMVGNPVNPQWKL